ncbi:unnamed protein product [Gordionus sp. m RMFG-2023]
MGYNDERRFPDFSFFTKYGTLNDFLSCVIISHFHLDHCGALPYMTEVIGYDGPIYMTHPTKAICPLLLEDYRKILVEKKGEKDIFTSEHIKLCMKKVIAVNLHESIKVEDDLYIKSYYAGHVLGAAMFLVKYGEASVLYTGDFNMTADRHLGTAKVDKCRPTLLITESTYATTVRDSKRCREGEFLKKIHECVNNGGKVLIPVFALGRAQELCILLDSYWERMNIKVPIYFSMGLTEKATYYYRMFISWTNEKIKKTFVDRNMFDFKHIKPFDKSYTNLPQPMVVFATPGMLHAGQSLNIFKNWAPDPKNMVILPGYCVNGTVGQKILSGVRVLEFDNNIMLEVKLAVEYMSFSAHADAKGILQLIRNCEPANVLLVHGEAEKMSILSGQIKSEFGVPCYFPANGENVDIHVETSIYADLSLDLLKYSAPYPEDIFDEANSINGNESNHIKTRNIETCCDLKRIIEGTILVKDNKLQLLPTAVAYREANIKLPPPKIRSYFKLALDVKDQEIMDRFRSTINDRKGQPCPEKESEGDNSIANAVRIFWTNELTTMLEKESKTVAQSPQIKSHHKRLKSNGDTQSQSCRFDIKIPSSSIRILSEDFIILNPDQILTTHGFSLNLTLSWDNKVTIF